MRLLRKDVTTVILEFYVYESKTWIRRHNSDTISPNGVLYFLTSRLRGHLLQTDSYAWSHGCPVTGGVTVVPIAFCLILQRVPTYANNWARYSAIAPGYILYHI